MIVPRRPNGRKPRKTSLAATLLEESVFSFGQTTPSKFRDNASSCLTFPTRQFLRDLQSIIIDI
jgi:hypothetical protein